MKVSVSRSVGRAFAIMEFFRQTREPASATQISRGLGAPHSSVVAVLHNLRELGYLRFDESDMCYFPTSRMLDLSAWLRQAPRDHGGLGALADRVARESGHMIAVCGRVSLFVNTMILHPGRFPSVAGPGKSVGAALANSIPGLVILSQLAGPEIADIVRETEAWLRDAGARRTFDSAAVLSEIDRVHARGCLAGPHPTCTGTEIIAYPVKSVRSTPLAVSVYIPACLSRDSKAETRQILETRLREMAACSGVSTPSAGENGFFFEKKKQKTSTSSGRFWA